MPRFKLVLYAITVVMHGPAALAFAEAAARLGLPRPLWWALALVAVSLGLVVGRYDLLRFDRPISRLRRVLLEEPYFVHWSAMLLGLVGFVFGSPVAFATEATLGEVALAAYGVSAFVGLYGVVVRRRWVRVRHVDVALPHLPEAFEGYRIAHLSDLHLGAHCPAERARRWVRTVNEAEVDLVALTGDFVTSGVRFHETIADVLGELRAKDGVFAVMGNHDYYGDGEPLMSLLRAQGVSLLRNESTRIERGDEHIVVTGVEDRYTRRDDIDKALVGLAPGMPIVALAHDPRHFDPLADGGAGLVLSGHTHWGQLAIPFAVLSLNLARLSYRYHAGRYARGDATLLISPGLGTTGPPLRLGAPPEITIIHLRAARE